MKNNKGITLVSVVVYIIGMLVIISIISALLAFYNKNMVNINNSSDISMEFSKFNSKLIEETKLPGNAITEIDDEKITFKSGNIYEFKDDKVYLNNIILSNYVKEFQANIQEQENKQILNIYILHERGKESLVHNQSYTISFSPGEFVGKINKIFASEPQPPEVDANGLAIRNTLITTSDSNIQIVIPEGFAPAILNGSDSTTSNPGQDGSIKSIMPAANWSNITAAQINAGVVIVNASGEEFVWVPIPNSSNFARTAWTWTYNNNTETQTLAETSTSSAYWDDKTTTEYTSMVNSVNTNKGFYISRYEASNNGSSVAQSKRGVSPWVEVEQTTAITASSANSISNTHLIYGIEWDSVLNWLIGKATIGTSTSGQTKTMESADVTDSRSWGNYSNSTGNAATNKGSKRDTAYNEYWKANNIYDLAGNVYEWTKEKYSTGAFRADRGGSYFGSGDSGPAASRGSGSETYTSSSGRFPFQLLYIIHK